MAQRIPEIKPGIKFLEFYQIIGGVFGVAITIWILKNQHYFNGIVALVFLIAFALYVYSIYCGLLLFRNVKKGLAHSRVNQILQAISFAIAGYAFQYVSGLYVYAGIDITNSFGLRFDFGLSSWLFSLHTNDPSLVVNLNLIALLLIVVIEKLFKRIKLQEDSELVATIGVPQENIG